MLLLKVKRWRHREAKWHVQGHRALKVPELRQKIKRLSLRGPDHPSVIPPLSALWLVMTQDNIVWVGTFLWQDFDKTKTQEDTSIQGNKSVLYYCSFVPGLPRNWWGHSRGHVPLFSRTFKSRQGWDSVSSKYFLSTNRTWALCIPCFLWSHNHSGG